jgi:uncharacterized protein
MLNRYLTYYKPAIQFVAFCAILSMSFLLGGSIINGLHQKLTGFTPTELETLMDIPAKLANRLKLLNGILLIITMLIPAMLFSYLAYPKPLVYLGLDRKAKPLLIIMASLLMIVAIPFTGLLEQWTQLIPGMDAFKEWDERYNRLAEAMMNGSSVNHLLLNILLMCILPAVVEETFFRGCLQNLMLSWMRLTPMIAIVLVAILFSAFHGQLSGFFPRFFLGLLLGLAYFYSGSLWLPLIMHALNNFITVSMMWLYHRGLSPLDMSDLPEVSLLPGLASAAAVAAILYFFYTQRIPFLPVEVEKEDSTLT